jgi:hypothetical protein
MTSSGVTHRTTASIPGRTVRATRAVRRNPPAPQALRRAAPHICQVLPAGMGRGDLGGRRTPTPSAGGSRPERGDNHPAEPLPDDPGGLPGKLDRRGCARTSGRLGSTRGSPATRSRTCSSMRASSLRPCRASTGMSISGSSGRRSTDCCRPPAGDAPSTEPTPTSSSPLSTTTAIPRRSRARSTTSSAGCTQTGRISPGTAMSAVAVLRRQPARPFQPTERASPVQPRALGRAAAAGDHDPFAHSPFPADRDRSRRRRHPSPRPVETGAHQATPGEPSHPPTESRRDDRRRPVSITAGQATKEPGWLAQFSPCPLRGRDSIGRWELPRGPCS